MTSDLSTPDRFIQPDPDRIRSLAAWLEESGHPAAAATAREVAQDLDVHRRATTGPFANTLDSPDAATDRARVSEASGGRP